MKSRDELSNKEWVLALSSPGICKGLLYHASKDIAGEAAFISRILEVYWLMNVEQKLSFIESFIKCTYLVGYEGLVSNFQTITNENKKAFHNLHPESDRDCYILELLCITFCNGEEILQSAAEYHRNEKRYSLNKHYLFDSINLDMPAVKSSIPRDKRSNSSERDTSFQSLFDEGEYYLQKDYEYVPVNQDMSATKTSMLSLGRKSDISSQSIFVVKERGTIQSNKQYAKVKYPKVRRKGK
jgi:hypothetical protein